MRTRRRVRGSAEQPRLSVFRSNRFIYAQIIDDTTGSTLVSASSIDADVRASLKSGSNADAAKAVGEAVTADEAGADAADFNNDGFLDIFHVNGMDEPGTNAYLDDPSRLFINNGDGSFTYVPDPEFSGTDTFQYRACFDAGETLLCSEPVTVTILEIKGSPRNTARATATAVPTF